MLKFLFLANHCFFIVKPVNTRSRVVWGLATDNNNIPRPNLSIVGLGRHNFKKSVDIWQCIFQWVAREMAMDPTALNHCFFIVSG